MEIQTNQQSKGPICTFSSCAGGAGATGGVAGEFAVHIATLLRLRVPARRRIGGSYTTLIYARGTLMDLMAMLSGLTQSVGLYQTAVKTLDEAKIASATHELNAKLMHFGAEVLAMQKEGLQTTERERAHLTRIHELEDQIRELEKRRADRERYDLVEQYPGVFTLRVKESARGSEPEHHLCPGCMDNDAVKSILQFHDEQKIYATCPKCKVGYRFKEAPPPRTLRRSNSPYLNRY